ncbi:MAG: hypothetical protein KY446_05920 [Proteobacteria bacterium]|nr:hypothetical protein [Pseudomonadota bacterium]
MAERGISNGTNSRSLNDTVAQTGPGIPDDALLPGEEIDASVDEATVERVRDQLDQIGEKQSKPE